MVLSLCWSFRKHPILAVDHSCFDFKIWYQLGSPDPQGPGSQSVCRCRCDSLTGRIIFFMRMKAKSDAVFVGAGAVAQRRGLGGSGSKGPSSPAALQASSLGSKGQGGSVATVRRGPSSWLAVGRLLAVSSRGGERDSGFTGISP